MQLAIVVPNHTNQEHGINVLSLAQHLNGVHINVE
jgi:hypothetical protein